MKNRNLFLIVLFLCGALNAVSQRDYRPGFVIKNNGDTIYGRIDFRGDKKMGVVSTFKSEDNEKTIFSPNDIQAYKFTNGSYYVSKTVNKKAVFLEVLVAGDINIYYRRSNEGDQYYIEKENIGISRIPYKTTILSKDDTQYLYKSKTHKGVLKYYMNDAPGIEASIDSINKPDHRNLMELAKKYHNIVCRNKDCVDYKKQIPGVKLNIEVTSGFLDITKIENIDAKNYVQSGVYVHLGIPRFNDKFYFKTGVAYVPTESNGQDKTTLKIPVQIEYMYYTGIIRPKIAFGLGFIGPGHTVMASAGANINIYKSVSLSLNFDLDFEPTEAFPLGPKSLASTGATAGLIFQF